MAYSQPFLFPRRKYFSKINDICAAPPTLRSLPRSAARLSLAHLALPAMAMGPGDRGGFDFGTSRGAAGNKLRETNAYNALFFYFCF